MSQHNDKDVKEFFRKIQALGFVITPTKKGFKIVPPTHIVGLPYFTHGTTKALKPMKRDFRRMYGVTVD